jgi:hypothetical protein
MNSHWLLSNFSYWRALTVFCAVLLCGTAFGVQAQTPTGELLRNGGFEGGSGSDDHGGGVPEWTAYEAGYGIDRNVHRTGDQSVRCDSLNTHTRLGAQTQLTLNQKRPVPILVAGWSKADSVGGVKDEDYSIYIDLEYMDGTPLWGQIAAFNVGTHDWERRQVLVLPAKPIKSMTIYALFRNHSGTAWFDDFSARALDGANVFDSQALPPLSGRAIAGDKGSLHVRAGDGLALTVSAEGEITSVHAGDQDVTSPAAGGFFVRDVARDGPLVAMRGLARSHEHGAAIGSGGNAAHVSFNAKIVPIGDSLLVDGEVNDQTNTDRAITVYLVLPIQADGWQWGQDIRHAETIHAGREYSNQVRVNAGATGGLSLYPFACVAGPRNSVGIASQMDWPSIFRLFYNGTTHQFVMAWDFALTGKTRSWPSHNARFRCTLFRLPSGQAEWGFRAAAQRFYQLNALAYTRRAKAEGIWIPFTSPARVEHPADFGFAYHEGDNSIKSDNALGILSFRYTEPMSYWMPMPPQMPRTYDQAIALLHKNAEGSPGEARDFSRATLNSGTQDENERFNLQFRNEPWANGAVFVLDPNPELPTTPDQPTKASINYTVTMGDRMYGAGARQERGDQAGEYLDSLESWGDTQDYRLSDIAACPYPIPFDTDSRRPVLPQWYSTHAFTRFLSEDLHNRGKLLMANTTPVNYTILAPLLDVMGIEVNWLGGNGEWRPDSDATLNLRRTMSGQKPYLLLMNTNFDKFTSPLVEKYFQRSLFYGIYPSMFSVNAADSPYWDAPRWYNRDRNLFVKYIPIIKRLSAAGWEPITQAHSANPAVYVERYGSRLFTVLNDSSQSQTTTLTIDLHALGLPTADFHVESLFTHAEVPVQRLGSTLSIPLHLGAEEVMALELKP